MEPTVEMLFVGIKSYLRRLISIVGRVVAKLSVESEGNAGDLTPQGKVAQVGSPN